jgi:hypothetical protein
VGINAGQFQDAFGNFNLQASNQRSLTVDTQSPTVEIARVDTLGTLKAGEAATLELSFSEVPFGLAADDILVPLQSNQLPKGEVLNLRQVGERTYRFEFKPVGGLSAQDIELSIGNGAFTDAAGNINQDGGQDNNKVLIGVNTQAPTISALAIQGYRNGAVTSDTLKAGDEIRVTATFTSEFVVEPGANNALPKYSLRLDGNQIREAFYNAAASDRATAQTLGNKLVLIYTVQPGDTDDNGITALAGELVANDATLRDSTGNAVNLTTAAVSASNITTKPTLPWKAYQTEKASRSGLSGLSN